MTRILIIDDDVELCAVLCLYFAEHGFELAAKHDARMGLEAARKSEFDLIILDVMLPGVDGFAVLRALRQWSQVGVLLLTARGGDGDRIMGFDSGADDYVAKPFHPPELIARMKAILRRGRIRPAPCQEQLQPARRLQFDKIAMDLDSRTVLVDGQHLDLTTVEFELLAAFVETPGQVLSREALLKRVFGRTFHPENRSLDMCVSRLRRKLNLDQSTPGQIKTIRSEGYLFTAGA
jgi:DNA-binding response OmpR family regulator